MANKIENKEAKKEDVIVIHPEETVQVPEEKPMSKSKKAKAWVKRNWKKVAGFSAAAGGVALIAALGMRKKNRDDFSDLSPEEAVEKLKAITSDQGWGFELTDDDSVDAVVEKAEEIAE